METFLNLIWVILSASLALLWIKGSSNASSERDWKVQLLALVMLALILLPVISMTDDMQAMSAAEVEHVTRRADLLPSIDQPADLVVPLSAGLLPDQHLSSLRTFARIEPSLQSMRPEAGYIRQLANRPPPIFA
ncbi:MAG TPA: hypothetical protein VKX41_05585 [Alloacidobacterium sp.]|nr:hypothetical protein [Alloacidobacterium sp.]